MKVETGNVRRKGLLLFRTSCSFSNKAASPPPQRWKVSSSIPKTGKTRGYLENPLFSQKVANSSPSGWEEPLFFSSPGIFLRLATTIPPREELSRRTCDVRVLLCSFLFKIFGRGPPAYTYAGIASDGRHKAGVVLY